MSVKLYSLLDYSVSIKFKNQANAVDIPIGGLGSYLGSISISKDSPNITRTTDTTGSGIFSYSANNGGTMTVELSYLSVKAQELMNRIVSRYYSPTKWKETLLDIIISKGSETIVEIRDAMLEGPPELNLGPEAAMRSFNFTANHIQEALVMTDLSAEIGRE